MKYDILEKKLSIVVFQTRIPLKYHHNKFLQLLKLPIMNSYQSDIGVINYKTNPVIKPFKTSCFDS